MREEIEKVLDGVRPYLRVEGGDVELVDVSEGVVQVRLVGACGGCPMSTMTLQNFIARTLKQQIPEVKEVVAV